MLNPGLSLDVTDAVTAAIAERLLETAGGNETLNWIEAEGIVSKILEQLVLEDEPSHAPDRTPICNQTLRREEQVFPS